MLELNSFCQTACEKRFVIWNIWMTLYKNQHRWGDSLTSSCIVKKHWCKIKFEWLFWRDFKHFQKCCSVGRGCGRINDWALSCSNDLAFHVNWDIEYRVTNKWSSVGFAGWFKFSNWVTQHWFKCWRSLIMQEITRGEKGLSSSPALHRSCPLHLLLNHSNLLQPPPVSPHLTCVNSSPVNPLGGRE